MIKINRTEESYTIPVILQYFGDLQRFIIGAIRHK